MQVTGEEGDSNRDSRDGGREEGMVVAWTDMAGRFLAVEPFLRDATRG